MHCSFQFRLLFMVLSWKLLSRLPILWVACGILRGVFFPSFLFLLPRFAWFFLHFFYFHFQLSLPAVMVFHFVFAFLHVRLNLDFLGCCFHIMLILCMLVYLMRFFFCFMHVGFVSQCMHEYILTHCHTTTMGSFFSIYQYSFTTEYYLLMLIYNIVLIN